MVFFGFLVVFDYVILIISEQKDQSIEAATDITGLKPTVCKYTAYEIRGKVAMIPSGDDH